MLNLILLIVFLVIGFIAITYCIYCCSCKSGWSNLRRRIVYRQLARDEEQISEEREASRAQIRDSLAPVVGVIAIICFIYCCSCKPAWAKARKRLVRGQAAREEEQLDVEREANRAQLRDSLVANKQTRDDVRQKYQLP
ncbi:unnamed protein product [Adineta steineri]|uniref:Uncharacterized protein n=1 Tax=Adineta steineri TaxID=433720 RepID=A0A814UKE3_9BILA|nr:unnamed protein product [Adineta steineri]CAF1291729.1 unnamed protein product [Adineta steineri]